MSLSQSTFKLKLILLFVFHNKICSSENLVRFNFKVDHIKPNLLEDALMTTPELLTKYGYPSETHYVTTSDGYILEMHRIPQKSDSLNSIPVLVMHGLFASSGDWILMGPNTGLAYYLSDLGYDVWLGNARGNRYSRNHTHLSIENGKFWSFSFHEIGYYDLPAMIDYILQNTGRDQLHYVGHSQGTTIFFVMASERPEFNKKIRLSSLLAPVAYVINFRAPMIRAAALMQSSTEFTVKQMFGEYQVAPYTEHWVRQRMEACNTEEKVRLYCVKAIMVCSGENIDQFNLTMMPVILGHTPAGVSLNQGRHYLQLIKAKDFVKYDHGAIINKKLYGTIKPPKYKLKNISAPIILYYSSNDLLADTVDVENLPKQIASVKDKYLVSDKAFSHTDFMWAIDGRKLVYGPMAERMMKMDKDVSGDK